ncbi:MAG: 6-carboxytetrahydropterin synthase QueD [Colwelliaceae bacterium]|nr:6-carboxytetrahydropterin synthase QueD [Colwelliaceae bacterium]|tara:strand:+ start:3527 stop:3976 length:450 start_codon:yes stop_codon:yes gene_type:complete
MTVIAKTIEINMGHRLPNHNSKCRNLHGHRYKIEVGVQGELISSKGSSDEGMIIDFGDLKKIMVEIIDDVYDHGLVLSNEDHNLIQFLENPANGVKTKLVVVDFIPTVENLTRHWHDLLKPKLEEKKILLKYVKTWETPTCFAVYEDED